MPALMPSELPEVARTRHHWVVLFRLPKLWPAVAGLVLLALAIFWPMPWMILFILVLGAVAFVRWQIWEAELIILTQKRIIRIQGVPETTISEAFLRIDRISGARMIQTVPGKIFKYGTIELEAPGEHPDVRRLKRIPEPDYFYGLLRRAVFGDATLSPDPDDAPPGFTTEPIPRVPDERRLFRR